MHALVFWGFVVLMLQVITLFKRAFDEHWSIPGFAADEPLGPPFFIARDLLEVVVIVGVLYMLYRRLFAQFAAVRARPRRAALPRRLPLGGRPDPRLHPADHGRRAALRRRPAGRGRHPHGRARLRAPGRGHGRGVGGTRPLHRRHDQRGRLVGALRDRPGVPVPPPPVQALPHPHLDPERLLRQAAAARS